MDPRSIIETIPLFVRTKLDAAQKADIHDRFGNHVPFKDSTFGRNGRGRHLFQLTFIQYQAHLKSFTDEGLKITTVRLIFDYSHEINSSTSCKDFISVHEGFLNYRVVNNFFHLKTEQIHCHGDKCRKRNPGKTWCEGCEGEPHALDLIRKEMTSVELIANLKYLKDWSKTEVVTRYSDFEWYQDNELRDYLARQQESLRTIHDQLGNFDRETARLIEQLSRDRAQLQTSLIDKLNSHDHCPDGREYLDEMEKFAADRRLKELEAKDQQAEVAKQERLASLEAKRQEAIALAAKLAEEIEQSK